jgi:ABC-type multidrug transport system permease subunit
MNHPFIQLTIAQIKEFFREPGALFWSFGFPILMALGLGVAFSGKKEIMHGVAVIPTESGQVYIVKKALLDDRNISDTIIERKFENENGRTRYIFHITSWKKAELLMKRGIINAIISEDENGLTYHYDPLNPEGELIQVQLSNFFRTGSLGQDTGSIRPLKTLGMRYIDFLVPGLLTMGIMMSVMWGVCYALIEKRSKKLLRRMVATPMKKAHFLLATWASRLILTCFDSVILLIFARYFFELKIQGSITALVLILLSGNIAFFGLSILISSRTANTQVGNGLISFITTPMMVVSGIFFSYQNFPSWVIKLIKFLPLTKFTDETRSIINEGAGLLDSMDGIAILCLFGVLTFIAGLRVYKWY